MAAETVQSFEALEAQAQILMSVFTGSGYEAVAPAIIQPADVFLDVVGEALRARTYVFTDPDGAELCLRPDLTVPTCRLHVARQTDLRRAARYCYNGSAFRFQPQGADAAHPREFRQAGIERFGDVDPQAAEADTVALIVRAIEVAGFKDWQIRIGDLGLFRAVLAAVDLPVRTQQKFVDAFSRPAAFRSALKSLLSPTRLADSDFPASLYDALRTQDPDIVAAATSDHLGSSGLEISGQRTLQDVALGLLAKQDAKQPFALTAEALGVVEGYVNISCPALQAGEKIRALLMDAPNGSAAALAVFDRRLALLQNSGLDLSRITFSAEFGRALAYYTGFVFEVAAETADVSGPIAGGGRYDRLLRAAGSPVDVAAVGAAIHTERLLTAVGLSGVGSQ